ncbi:MAG: PEP-CTERM sorting domain-containing protein, partial [Pyrinomonadaceae bacterium]
AKHNRFTGGAAGAPVVELMSAPEVCVEPAPVLSAPEPASMLLLGTGLLGIGALVRRTRKKRD